MSGALMPQATAGLNPSEETIAELLKAKGYTTGLVGKWHLGSKPEFMPLKQGFDEYFGLPYSNDMWAINYDGTLATTGYKAQHPPLTLIDGGQPVDTVRTQADQDGLTERLTQRAVSFIKKNKSKPFFLYFPHPMPHVPLGASAKFRGKTGQGLYADVMAEVDWSVGQVMQALETNGLDKNTLVIFTSDNGPWLTFGNHAGSSGALREGKGTTYEGGNRVPCLIRWPGVVPAGRVSNKLLTNMDLLPTIASFCGAKLPVQQIDGLNAMALFKGDESKVVRREFYYYYKVNSLQAVRRDHFKLVFPHSGRRDEGYRLGVDGNKGENTENFQVPYGLYDLSHDPGERYDVSKQYPQIVTELENLAEIARKDLGDDLQKRPSTHSRPAGKVGSPSSK
jgi:arylsulfatase